MEQLQQWRRLDGSPVKKDIVDEIRSALVREKEAGHELKVCIGTDSQVKGAETAFATVIVFLRKGKGGFMYINTEISEDERKGKDAEGSGQEHRSGISA